jgi:hypothetical protein
MGKGLLRIDVDHLALPSIPLFRLVFLTFLCAFAALRDIFFVLF